LNSFEVHTCIFFLNKYISISNLTLTPEKNDEILEENHFETPRNIKMSAEPVTVTTVTDSSIPKGPYATKLESLIKSTYEQLLTKAIEIDKKFDVVTKVTDLAKKIDAQYAISNKADELNKKYAIKEKVVSYTEKIISVAQDINTKYHVMEKVEPWKNWVMSY
jgi:hypothetical protein